MERLGDRAAEVGLEVDEVAAGHALDPGVAGPVVVRPEVLAVVVRVAHFEAVAASVEGEGIAVGRVRFRVGSRPNQVPGRIGEADRSFPRDAVRLRPYDDAVVVEVGVCPGRDAVEGGGGGVVRGLAVERRGYLNGERQQLFVAPLGQGRMAAFSIKLLCPSKHQKLRIRQ